MDFNLDDAPRIADFSLTLEGDTPTGPLPRRYRVPHDHYIAAWDDLIRRYHRAVPLEEVLGGDEDTIDA